MAEIKPKNLIKGLLKLILQTESYKNYVLLLRRYKSILFAVNTLQYMIIRISFVVWFDIRNVIYFRNLKLNAWQG